MRNRPETQDIENHSTKEAEMAAKMTEAPFLDRRIALTIILVVLVGVVMTTLISIFKNSLGTISFGGS